MKSKTICLMVLACLPLSLHAGPAFEKAINKGVESESNYIGRLKTMGLWFVSKMDYLKAVSASSPCMLQLHGLHSLIENTLVSQYSWGADAIKEIERELPAEPISPKGEQAQKTLKIIIDTLFDYYGRLYQKLSALGSQKIGDDWSVFGDPARIKF